MEYEIRTRYSDWDDDTDAAGGLTEVWRAGGREPLTEPMSERQCQDWIVRRAIQEGMICTRALSGDLRVLWWISDCESAGRPWDPGSDGQPVYRANMGALARLIIAGLVWQRADGGKTMMGVTDTGLRRLRDAGQPTRERLFPRSARA